MPLSSTVSPGGAAKCILNDQMGPFTVLYILILIVGLPGNLLSVWAFIRTRRVLQQQSVSVYLINLLLADILLLMALPFKVLKDLGEAPWKLMVFHCQATAVIIYISLYASIAFLAFLITNQYLQDCRTVRSLRLQEPGFAWMLSLVVWMLLLLIMVPNMALPIKEVQVQRYLSCSSLKKEISLHWHTLTVFLCTALFLNASAAVLVSSSLALKRLLHSRSDSKLWVDARQVAVSLAAMASAYFLSFVPYHVVRTPYTLAQAKVITDCQTKRQLFLGKESTLLLSVLHVCFDPLLFFYLHHPFRATVRRMLASCRSQAVSDEEEQAVGDEEEQAVGDEEEQAVGDEEEQTVGDEEEQAVGDEDEQAVGDEEEQAVGVEEEQAVGVEEEQAVGVEEEQAVGDEEEQAVGDEEEQAVGDEEEQAVGDEDEQAVGDEEEQAVGDEEEQAVGDEEEQAVGDEEEQAVGDEEEQAVGDEEEQAVGVEEEQAVGDEEEQAVGDEEEQAVGDEEEQAVGDEEEQAVGVEEEQAVGVEEEQAVGDEEEQAVGDEEEQAVGVEEEQAVGDEEE